MLNQTMCQTHSKPYLDVKGFLRWSTTGCYIYLRQLGKLILRMSAQSVSHLPKTGTMQYKRRRNPPTKYSNKNNNSEKGDCVAIQLGHGSICSLHSKILPIMLLSTNSLSKTPHIAVQHSRLHTTRRTKSSFERYQSALVLCSSMFGGSVVLLAWMLL